MIIKPRSRRLVGFIRSCALIFIVCIPAADAIENLSLEIEGISHPFIKSSGIQLRLDLRQKPSAIFTIDIEQLTLQNFSPFRHVQITCPLSEKKQTTHASFTCTDGQLHFQHQHWGRLNAQIQLQYSPDNNDLKLDIENLKTAAGLLTFSLVKNAENWQVNLRSQAIRVEKLRKMLSEFFSFPDTISDESGKVKINAEVLGDENTVKQATLSLSTKNLNFNGNSVAENLAANLQLNLQKSGKGWAIKERLNLQEGIVYIEPGFKIGNIHPGFLLEPSELKKGAGIQLDFDAHWEKEKLTIHDLKYKHPDHLDTNIQGKIIFSHDEKVNINKLQVGLSTKKFKKLFPVYLQPFLFGSGMDKLEIIGGGSLDLSLSDNAISDFHLILDHVYADDALDRFLVSDLSGDIRLNSDPKPVDSKMQWQGGSIYQVNIGPGEFNLRSQGRSMWLRKRVDIPVFDGRLQIGRLIMNQLGLEDYAIHLDANLTPITLSEFTESMGWPLMAGSISGEIPGLSYYKGDLTVDGSLNVNVFEGDLSISDLEIRDLFGLVPSVFANIRMDDLDLGRLTETFEFGRITGKLEGGVENLQLQDWQPVHFDAWLQTPDDDKGPHRISQRAVDNITSLGGGGGASSMVQRGVLGLFEDFPYSKIGIRCELRQNLCHMDGVSPAKEGYYIVKRGFFPPWLDIIGFNRVIDWQELVDRLKSLKETESPVIQ